MKKILFFSVAVIFLQISRLQAQQVFSFENLTMPVSGYWNGSDGSGSFGNNSVSFPNSYDLTYNYWSGFAYSDQVDNSTVGFENQYSVFTGNAHSGSVFGLGYIAYSSQVGNIFVSDILACNFNMPIMPQSVFVANSTYAALSMRDGDDYSAAFSVSAHDYFKLQITGKFNGAVSGTKEIMLADYTGAVGIISDVWQNIDLSSFSLTDKIEFVLISTKGNAYGMTNPAYFCFDDLSYNSVLSVEAPKNENISVYPNPFVDKITVENSKNSQIAIFDISGKTVFCKIGRSENSELDLSTLKSGFYFLKTENRNGTKIQKILKI
jgi:hypothetical protein